MTAAPAPSVDAALAWAHPLTQEWFTARFSTATEPQVAGWPAILRRESTLISAPTGSGKTLAAFLVCLDTLLRRALEGRLPEATQVVYISPLKALSNDVQKNLDGPLAELQQLALERGFLCPEIRTGVRTGDTPMKDRAGMLRRPPHILVTTPESLYMMLTAAKARETLRRVETVIVDEIHAVADDKRGAHLALTLERLEALVRGVNRLAPGTFLTGLLHPPQRIGLSATQNPIELVGNFLTGSAQGRPPATIVQVGQRRTLDLAIEVPSDELSSIASTAMWEEVYDKLASLAEQHRSTLVFVNTRRLVEKLAFELTERLGPDAVAAHHGSLSRALRLDAEQRLKAGEIRILIATASLELGIDIGHVDLVCQIHSTRALAVAMQRVGRAGHWRGATPKGRFFAMTRDDLMEQAALIRGMRAGDLDRLEIPDQPTDVLMQQIVAACGAESWEEEALFDTIRRAWPYRNLTRNAFDEVLTLLHEGIESRRGRYGAYLLRDRVQGQLHARRGARMTAIANGGAIPDTSIFAVMLQPENVQIATLDEHFAVDSGPGDVVLLGNASWRIQRVDPQGKVLVEDAHGAAPSIPFWEGEAPQRTARLSEAVSDLRAHLDRETVALKPSEVDPTHPAVAAALLWLQAECGVCASAALQMIRYVVHGRSVLGVVPTHEVIVAERFFDEGGGQQLILHAPFGGRLNKAWGLALRKRFCRGFNFELQAAATDNGINISLAEQHSFPLAEVFDFLTAQTARELLEQASIPSPLFKNRWRWAASRSLQLLRMHKGKRIAPQVQRTRSDDLLASVFPHASACPETMVGDIEIPKHPLVDEVMRDTLQEAMDCEGLETLLARMASGEVRCVAIDTPVPSVFAHELIHAMPYAYLDPEDAAARRARAVNLRRTLPDTSTDGAGRLDRAAIETVREQIWPDPHDEHELHDLLLQLVAVPVPFFASAVESHPRAARHWSEFLRRLEEAGRARRLWLSGVDDSGGVEAWVATERLSCASLLWPSSGLPTEETLTPDTATILLVQGWLQILGPLTARSLGAMVSLHPRSLLQALLGMEMQGIAMRGAMERPSPTADATDGLLDTEWCERRILHRIHRLTLQGLRRSVEPISPGLFVRALLDWQHLAPETQLDGEEGVLAAIEQLEGFEAPAAEWERILLPQRVRDYDPRWLDNLCLAGVIGWARVSPHPAWHETAGHPPRRVIPSAAAPITFFLRESATWLHQALEAKCVAEAVLTQSLSPEAHTLRRLLAERGAAFTADLQRLSGFGKLEVTTGLWELATAGLASADGYDQLRAMMDPRRKVAALEQTPAINLRKRAHARTTSGRWSLLCEARVTPPPASQEERAQLAIQRAKEQDRALESFARVLVARYGVVFRELLAREPNAPRWRDLVGILRRLEARGELRGGRFVSGAFGEQFAAPEIIDLLQETRRRSLDRTNEPAITVSACDPANLVSIVIPGDREAAIPGRLVEICRGGRPMSPQENPSNASGMSQRRKTAATLLRESGQRVSPNLTEAKTHPRSPGLFG